MLARLDKVLNRQKDLEKELEALKSRLAAAQAGDLLDQVRQVAGVPVLALKVEAADPKGLREFAVKLQERLKSGIVVLGAAAGDKAMLIALVTKDLSQTLPGRGDHQGHRALGGRQRRRPARHGPGRRPGPGGHPQGPGAGL